MESIPNIMPPCPKHLLILFDWDGCTAIIESSRVQCSRKKVLSKSSRGTLSYEGRLHKVEILELSDSKEELEDYDTEWEQTHRALAISSEREKRQNSRGRRKTGGYLDIWNDPESITSDNDEAAEDIPSTSQSQQQQSQQEDTPVISRSFKEGSKGRKITVLFEGLADTTNSDISPKRSPMYLDDLTTDEQEIVVQQVLYYEQGKTTSSSQTDKVIVIQDEKEILELITDSKVKKTSSTQTTLVSTKVTATQTATQTGTPPIQKPGPTFADAAVQTCLSTPQEDYARRMERKIDEILSIVKKNDRRDQSLSVSEVYQWAMANVPNGSTIQSTPTISIYREEDNMENTATPIETTPRTMSIPSVVTELSPITNSENIQRESVDSPDTDAANSNVTVPKKNLCDREPLKELVPNKKRRRILVPNCKKDYTVKEISCPEDVEAGQYEFKMRREQLEKLHGSSCSEGNFLWNVVKTVYSDHELVGKNFFGRKNRPALSPRRVHLIEHCYLDFCGDNMDEFTKAVNAINSGIRAISRK